jgi:PAS domain S-box-containing protein
MRIPDIVRMGVLGVLYVVTAQMGLTLDAVNGFAAAVWPPTGLALVALVLYGPHLWPSVALSAFFVNWWAGAPVLVAGGMALGNTLEALLGSVLLTRVVRFRPALDRLRDVLGLLVLAAGLSPLVSATLGVTSGWLGGVIPAATYGQAWRTWWLGDALGALVVAPLLFVWSGHGRGALPRRRLPEALLLLVTVGVLSLAVFGDLLDPIHPHFPYLVFPPLIWAALRLGPHGAVTTTALVAASAIWGTVQGEGPFARGTLQESLVGLQAFMSVVAVTMLVFAAVVAERQRAEDARVWFAAMVESSEDAIIGKTLEGIITSWNPGAERLYGYTAAEMHGQSIARLIPPELPDDLPQLLAQIRRGQRLAHYETVRRHKDGTRLHISLSISPIVDTAGQLVGAATIARDITERTRAAIALQQQRDWLNVTLASIGDAVVATDAQGIITLFNPIAERLTGWPAAEALERPIGEVFRVLQRDTGAQADDPVAHVLREGVPVSRGAPTLLCTRQGQAIAIAESAAPIRARGGGLAGVVLVFRDITAQVQMEEQLRQVHHLQALGTLAGGIAHDFNNVLAAIVGYTELAAMDLPPSSATHTALHHTLAAAQRAKDLVQQILLFSRQQPAGRAPLALASLLQEAVTFLRASLPATIGLHLHLADTAGPVLADATQIHQVVMNLCTNAGVAMRETGGTLDIHLDGVEVDPTVEAPHPDLTPGPYVRVTVRDTGPGILPEVLGHIFEPYFTTKAVGEGSGMGLAVVHGIVASHGGAVTVQSAPGQGAVFTVYLPRLAQDVPVPPAAAQDPLPRGHERILLVDDEASVAEMAQRLLTRLGYVVVAYTSSREALDAFRAAPNRFDLLITDHTMSEMTGEALARAVRQIRPELPLILCTGFSETMTAEHARELGIDAYLMKPWEIGVLAQTLRRVLTQRPLPDRALSHTAGGDAEAPS